MAVIETSGLGYRYGRRVTALRDVDLTVPEGSVYALLGPNGSGKTTLLQVVLGLRRATAGRVTVMGRNVGALTVADRALLGYVAEGQALPGRMTLRQLEAYLAPLYATWDDALAAELRARFELDPARRLGTLSRGEGMKAALLCALAPRPRLLIMDEPFTGMDALVKDDLVRGLLGAAAGEACTILICSHDLVELETLADHVGFLHAGRLLYSDTMDALRERFFEVEVRLSASAAAGFEPPADWLSFERAGQRAAFVLARDRDEPAEATVRRRIPDAERIDARAASLQRIFIALARTRPPAPEAAR